MFGSVYVNRTALPLPMSSSVSNASHGDPLAAIKNSAAVNSNPRSSIPRGSSQTQRHKLGSQELQLQNTFNFV